MCGSIATGTKTAVSAVRPALFAAFMALVVSTAAFGQTTAPLSIAREISLSGPRIGVTVLSAGSAAAVRERGIDIGPVISQFGWQFEKRFYSNGDGLTALQEWVPMIGGLEQGLALPSLSWMVGLRTREGAEFGVGPNLTAAGVALAVAGGVTLRSGALNVPVNVAVVTSKSGVRVSLLTGFNLRRR